MNQAASSLAERKELQRAVQGEMFTDRREQEQGSYAERVLVLEAGLLRLHEQREGLERQVP